MFAIRADHVVVVAQRRQRADGDRFLADVQVTESADLAERVRLRGLFLEAPDQQHLPQHLEKQLGLRCR